MNHQQKARCWTYRRQRLGRTAPDLMSALAAVVGVYSVRPSGPLSLWARAPLSMAALRRAEDGFEVVRIPAMRTSGHLVPSTNLVVAISRERPRSQRHRNGGYARPR